jgi:hypothetical protein
MNYWWDIGQLCFMLFLTTKGNKMSFEQLRNIFSDKQIIDFREIRAVFPKFDRRRLSD